VRAGSFISLSNDWVQEGEDEVVLIEEGTIRLAVPLRSREACPVTPDTLMRQFALSFTKSGRFIEFLAAVRSGHTYSVRCSPCCLVLMSDEDDDPYDFDGDTVFTDSSGGCPEDMIPLFPGLAEDPDGKHRCVSAPRIRFKVSREIFENGALFIDVGEGLGNEMIQVVDEAVTRYHSFDIVQSGAPARIRLLQNEKVLWEGMVIFRVKHSYTLRYDLSEKPAFSIKLDD
jgi:hypothetical protein